MENLTLQTFKSKIFDFEQTEEFKYNGTIPCIIDFYADWCQPCKQLHPILENISKEYENKINVYRINVDEEMELSEIFKIKSIPTLLFIPMDGEPKMLVGGVSKDNLKKLIIDVLKVE